MNDGIQQPRKNISSLAIQGFDLITENPQLEPPKKARFTRSTNKKHATFLNPLLSELIKQFAQGASNRNAKKLIRALLTIDA